MHIQQSTPTPLTQPKFKGTVNQQCGETKLQSQKNIENILGNSVEGLEEIKFHIPEGGLDLLNLNNDPQVTALQEKIKQDFDKMGRLLGGFDERTCGELISCCTSFCNEHPIKASIVYGSLLGALTGFIKGAIESKSITKQALKGFLQKNPKAKQYIAIGDEIKTTKTYTHHEGVLGTHYTKENVHHRIFPGLHLKSNLTHSEIREARIMELNGEKYAQGKAGSNKILNTAQGGILGGVVGPALLALYMLYRTCSHRNQSNQNQQTLSGNRYLPAGQDMGSSTELPRR